jgi:hypothetical protein
MAHRFDQTHLTVARELTSDGAKRYLVWLRRDEATVVLSYEASSAEEAKRMALAELAEFEAMAHRI